MSAIVDYMDAIALIELARNISATTNDTLAQVQAIIDDLDAQNFETEVAALLEIAQMQLSEAQFIVDTVYPNLQRNFTIAAGLVDLGVNRTTQLSSELIALRRRVNILRTAVMFFNGSSASLALIVAQVMMSQANLTEKASLLIADTAASMDLVEETQQVTYYMHYMCGFNDLYRIAE